MIVARLATTLACVLAIAAAPPLRAQDRDSIPVRILSLGDAARLAAAQSAAARAAHERTAQASARVRQQMAGFLPSAGVAGSVREFTMNSATELRFAPSPGATAFEAILPAPGILFPPIKDYELQGRVQDTLFSFGAIERYRSAQTSRTAAEASADNASQQAGATAASTYLAAQRAAAEVGARTADSALAADLVEIARQQLAAGVGIQLDVTRAEAQLAASHAQLIVARTDLSRAHLDLLRALGLPLESQVVLSDSLARLPLDIPLASEADAIDEANRKRPDLRAADLQLAAARQGVTAARATYLPTLSGFAQDGSSAGTLSHVLPTYNWGIALIIPVFDGFNILGHVQEQQAVVRELEVERRDLRQQAAIEVRTAYLDLGSAREQLDATREQLTLTSQQVDQARERFRAGVASNADVITAALALNGARTQEIDALNGYQTARVALARATGTVTSLP
jgi:outer membrane protein TolC